MTGHSPRTIRVIRPRARLLQQLGLELHRRVHRRIGASTQRIGAGAGAGAQAMHTASPAASTADDGAPV